MNDILFSFWKPVRSIYSFSKHLERETSPNALELVFGSQKPPMLWNTFWKDHKNNYELLWVFRGMPI